MGASRSPAAAADLDFHAAVVDAAHNSLLSHVNALIGRVEAAAIGRRPATRSGARAAAVVRGDPRR